ncbi:MAG TPA: hypothetical protein VMF06_20370 [Candidatus Limnocylindria bacterium]|nr:hypothetical protein [Candidatus Limnocylindria bacterium]
MKLNYLYCGLLAAALAAGCASDGGGKTANGQPLKNKVLVNDRQAAALMRSGNYAEAKALLDDSILTLGGISAGDSGARKARSMFSSESSKTFRGEPYERVMVFYYRGILYWMDGEPDNARACFRTGQVEDSDAQENAYQGDYVLLDYLDGLASVKLAADGSDSYKRAEKNARMIHPPAYDPQANVLVFAEMGYGPTKYATGEHSEELRIRDGSSRTVAANIRVGGTVFRAPAYDNLSYQASTRGGRVMDHILANKAVFKDTTQSIGTAAIIGGAVAAGAGGRQGGEIGLGLVGAGVILNVLGSITKPAADTRQWDNLPQYLGFSAFRLPPGNYQAAVDFVDTGGGVVASRPLTFTVASGRDTVLFVSDHN